jgi:acyl-CoA synthetase (NDP forming)
VEPKAIAVVGASPRAESIPGRVIETLKGNGFLGEIFPVNPRHASVSGSRAYRSLAELPAVPDVVVVVTAAPSAVSAVRQAADLGVPFAVILSSGFNETDAGSGLAKELLEIKEQSGIRILGPNCQGLVDTSRGLAIGFNAEIDPARRRKTLKEGRGVVISQSSGLGFAFANRIAEGLGGVRAIVTTGNEIDLEVADFVEFYAEDGGAPLIVFAEALRSPRRFVSAALKARSLGVDIVVIKAGTSTEGKLAAQSHTGKLTGDADIYSAVFAKAGVVTVDNSDDLIDAAGALTFGRRLPGRRIGVVTTSGGGGVWMTDHLVGAGFEVRQFPLELQARLRERLSSFAAVGNPVDVTAQSAYDSSLGFVLEILDQSQEVDGLVLVGNFGSSTWIGEGTGVEAALHSRRLPVVVYSYTEPTDGAVSLFSSLQVP